MKNPPRLAGTARCGESLPPFVSSDRDTASVNVVTRVVHVDAVRELVVAEYPECATQREHTHDYSSISFVARGRVRERANGRERIAGPGAVLLKPAGIPHADVFEIPGTRVIALRIRPADTRASRASRRYSLLRDARLSRAFLALAARLRDTAVLVAPRAAALTAELLAIDAALASIARSTARGSAWCDAVAATLELDPVRSTRSLAHAFGVHPVALARAFRLRLGMTPTAYSRRVRIERAAAAINAGEPLAGAAALAGFCDQAHLTRSFSAEFGATPGEYRAISG